VPLMRSAPKQSKTVVTAGMRITSYSLTAVQRRALQALEKLTPEMPQWSPTNAPSESGRRGPKRRQDDPFLERVAAAYRRLRAAGNTWATSRDLAVEFGATRTQARTWIKRARDKGYLGERLAVGKAGERNRPQRAGEEEEE
jgi:hypothetical protein